MRKPMAPERVVSAILMLRGQRVLFDSELATLYGVSTRRFNEQVRRNRKRFPADFMFQLTAEETSSLRSQIATLKTGRGQHRKYLPYVFTEHGAIIHSSAREKRLVRQRHFPGGVLHTGKLLTKSCSSTRHANCFARQLTGSLLRSLKAGIRARRS